MALFGSNRDQFLTFFIVLTDPAAVAANQALYPTGVILGPVPAAVQFAAPWQGYTQPAAAIGNYTWSPWSAAALGTGPFLTDRAVFSRHSGGVFGMGGVTTRFVWVGQFVLAATATGGAVPASPSAIPQRTWTIGFEDPGGGEFGQNAIPSNIIQFFLNDASRHVGQRGFAMRGNVASGSVAVTAFRAAYSPQADWERLYIRGRNPDPLVSVPFWRSHDLGADAGGAEMFYTPAGNIAVTNNDGGAGTVWNLGNISLTAFEWTRIDILTYWNGGAAYHYGSSNGNQVTASLVTGAGIGTGVQDGVSQILIGGANGINSGTFTITAHTTDSVSFVGPVVWYDKPYADLPTTPHSWTITSVGGGTIQFYRNGALVVDQLITVAMAGIGRSGAHHSRSEIGNGRATANKAEFDLDDWCCMDVPNLLVPSKDWIYGSKLALVRGTGFGASHANWTGDFRVALQQAMGATTAKATLTSSVGAAHMAVKTDADISVAAQPGGLGAVAVCVTMSGIRGAGSGSLGYSLAGAAEVMTAVTQPAAYGCNGVLVSFADTTPIVPLELRHIKGAAADAASVGEIQATVETIGIFTSADVSTAVLVGATMPVFPVTVGQHNGPYPRTPWALAGLAPPLSPIVIKSGNYVGNGTGISLSFRAPIHVLFCRPLAGSAGGWRWWSTMSGTHRFDVQGIEPEHMVRAVEDFTFAPAGVGDDNQQTSYFVHIVGAHAQSNQVGVTYEYVAFSDPGMRFLECGSLLHPAAVPTFINALLNSVFTPQWAFLFPEEISNSAAASWTAKSEGHVSDSITKTSGSTVTNALTFGAGKLTSQTPLHTSSPWGVPFAAFRRSDGNMDPGEVNIAAYSSYIGDGAASRSIAFSPVSTKRPLWAIVLPENAAALLRDPAHTGTTSETENGTANAATGITAGAVNGMTVGVVLNANGIRYHYFVFLGSDVAGNNGWSIDGEFFPVESTDPVNGPLVPATLPSATTTTPTTITPPLGIGTQLSTFCAPYTTEVVNIALSRIGNSRQIPDLATDVTQEAFTARLVYGLDLGIVLRDFDWPFATRYADLVLVAGTVTVPVNEDWQYAYRAPSDMVKARRLVSQGGTKRAFDPNPPTFRVGSDASGPLLYTNADISTLALALEYTALLPCGAASGDYLFRDALAWKVAHSVAGSLSRDVKIVTYCWQMYQIALRNATPVAANESQPDPAGDASWISDRG